MGAVRAFLGKTHGKRRRDWSDYLSYFYLFMGVFVMFSPVIWLVLSSFKTPAALSEFPPSLLPYVQSTTLVPGYDQPLPLYDVRFPDGTVRRMAQVRRVGIQSQMVDPAAPNEIVKVDISQRT